MIRVTRAVQLNTTCNLGCVFCGADGRGLDLMTADRLEREARGWKSAGVTRLIIRGGEPTLSTRLPQVLRVAKSLGMDSIELHTNGLMLAYGEFADRLAAAGLTRVRFFLPAHEPGRFDETTSTAGLFPRAVEGIENAARRGFSVEFAIPIFLGNMETVPDTVGFAMSTTCTPLVYAT